MNLLSSWFRNILAFDNGPVRQEFSIVDPTAAQADGLNTVVLAVDPSDGNSPTIVSLYFDGTGIKLFEKKYQDDQDAQVEMSAMAKDLQEAATLSKEGKTEEAKNLATSLFDKYKRSSDPLSNEQPTPTMTQASQNGPLVYKGFSIKQLEDGSWQAAQDELAFRADSVDSVKAKIDNMLRKTYGKKLAKSAGVIIQNVFIDTPEEAIKYQEEMKKLQGPESGEGKPLWEQTGNTDEQVAPSNETTPDEDNELAPPSLSFDRIEKDKAKTDKDIGKRIKEQVKTEVESALEQKSASVFGPDQEDLVEAMKLNGRNWDEIKKYFVKDLSYNEDDTTVFIDSIRQKEEGSLAEGLPMPPKPPEDLVSPETHDKLVKEIEDKTEIKPEPKPLADEIARADNAEIRKVADVTDSSRGRNWKVTYYDKNDKVISSHTIKDRTESEASREAEGDMPSGCEDWSMMPIKDKKSSLNKSAINPLQEPPAIGQTPGQSLSTPVEEAPTFDAPVPEAQTSAPEPEYLEAPHEGDRVYVMGDYETGEDGFEGTMGSDFKSKGDDYAVIYQDNGDSREVALHRVVKASQKKVAQAYYEKKAKHEHEYRKGKSDSVVTCSCGAFKFTEEHLKKNPPITEKKASKCPICTQDEDAHDPFVCEKAVQESRKSRTMPPIPAEKKAGYDTDYSGYTNRSTWGLSLWLDNDQKFYDLSRQLAESAPNSVVLASYLKDSFNGFLEQQGEENMSSKEVNWNEIAQNLLDEAKENAEYEHSQSPAGVIESLPTIDVEKEKDVLLDQLAKETDPERKKSLEQKYKRLSMANVDPELQSLHESALKLQAELECEGEIAIYFHKEGIEKKADVDCRFCGHGDATSPDCECCKHGHVPAEVEKHSPGWYDKPEHKEADLKKKASDDSAFEANGWCRVWVQDVEIESDAKYPEILKIADETVRIKALKELARDIAHQALRDADNAANKFGVQAWFDVLTSSDHDRIDWVALANPEPVESSQDPKMEKKAEHPGGPCTGCGKDLPTVYGATFCKNCVEKGLDKKHFEKQAADPVPVSEVPVTYKELERAPKHTDRSKALPATQEQAEVAKSLQISMASIESIKDLVKRVKADLDKRILAIQQAGGLSNLEEGKKKEVDQLAALINATENKLISYGEHLYGYAEQTEKVGPKLTDAWRVEKLVEKFAGAAEYLKAAEAGAQNMAKEVTTKTLTKFPKLSRLDKQAGFLDSLGDVYSNVLEALKLIIGSEEPAKA